MGGPPAYGQLPGGARGRFLVGVGVDQNYDFRNTFLEAPAGLNDMFLVPLTPGGPMSLVRRQAFGHRTERFRPRTSTTITIRLRARRRFCGITRA